MFVWNKDPDSIENVPVPWSRMLDPGVTISTLVVITSPSGLTVVGTPVISGQITIPKISGGVLGSTYDTVYRITTSDGQTLDYHFQIYIKQKTD